MTEVVHVPLSTQLLAMTIGLQFVAFMAVLWRGIFGLPQLSSRRPRWPFIPLVLGSGLGVWYAWIQQDLVFGVAQALALFIGFCLINSTRGQRPADAGDLGPDGQRLTRRERRERQRAAKRPGADSGQ